MNTSTPSGSSGSGLTGAANRHDDHIIHRISEIESQRTPLAESGPVFADPSGRRHRVLRYTGLAAAAVLAACLGAVIVAMTGGPQAPFTQWAAQRLPATSASGHASARPAGGGTRGPLQDAPVAAPGASTPVPSSPSPFPGASPSARPSPSATASTSAAPANPAGRTPPGHTKSPNPHRSASAA
jgi:hypothetical protein